MKRTVLISSICAVTLVAVFIVLFAIRPRFEMDCDKVSDVMCELVLFTRESYGYVRMLENADWFTDECIRSLYPDFDRDKLEEQLREGRESLQESVKRYEKGDSLTDLHYEININSVRTFLDQNEKKGISIVQWVTDESTVYYTIFYYYWNNDGLIYRISTETDALYYEGGYSNAKEY